MVMAGSHRLAEVEIRVLVLALAEMMEMECGEKRRVQAVGEVGGGGEETGKVTDLNARIQVGRIQV